MIMFGALLICLAVTLIFYFIDKERYLWWEFFIPVISTTLLILLMKAMIDYSSVQFTEYWGETMESIYEQEPYNYWQFQTCTRSYPCGTDANGNTQYCTESYDCSHQVDVGPSWGCKTNLDNGYKITEHQYDSILILWGSNKKIIGSNNNYSSNDRCSGSKGTKFEGKKVGKTSYVWQVNWLGTDSTRKGYFTTHRYENRIKCSDLTLFNISVVSKEEADSLGLYEYPEIHNRGLFSEGNNFYFPTIFGGDVSEQTQENFRKLNAKFGPSNKLRLWVLVFDNKPASVAAYQENYWVKGNKNELVICIGTNGQEITWAHSFSWSLSGELTAEVTQKVLDLYMMSIETKAGQKLPVAIPVNSKLKETIGQSTGLDTALLPPVLPLNFNTKDITQITKSKTPVLNEQTWIEYYNYLNANLHRFEKRSFEEFSYIKVVPKTGQIILLYIFALISSIGINLWTFKNELRDKNHKDKKNWRYY